MKGSLIIRELGCTYHPELKRKGVRLWGFRGEEYNSQEDGKGKCLETNDCHALW